MPMPPIWHSIASYWVVERVLLGDILLSGHSASRGFRSTFGVGDLVVFFVIAAETCVFILKYQHLPEGYLIEWRLNVVIDYLKKDCSCGKIFMPQANKPLSTTVLQYFCRINCKWNTYSPRVLKPQNIDRSEGTSIDEEIYEEMNVLEEFEVENIRVWLGRNLQKVKDPKPGSDSDFKSQVKKKDEIGACWKFVKERGKNWAREMSFVPAFETREEAKLTRV